MRRALAGTVVLLLLLGSLLSHWRTYTSYTRRGPGTRAPALHLLSVTDTWHARAALAQLPPPPPRDLPPTPQAAALPRPQASFSLPPNTQLPALPLPVIPPFRDSEASPPTPAPIPEEHLIPSPAASPTPPAAPPRSKPGRATPPPQKVSTAPPTPPHSSPDAPRTASHTPARYRSAPPPPYPASLRAQRISGSVGVLISIDSEGAPSNVTITHSSGYPEFDDTARRWILRHWRFHPATRSGIPHPSQVRTSVRFVLH